MEKQIQAEYGIRIVSAGRGNQKVHELQSEIVQLGKEENRYHLLLKNELHKLTYLKYVYVSANVPEKQELLRMWFDSLLYYKNGVYRTGYMMEIFHHSLLILKEKQLLELDK